MTTPYSFAVQVLTVEKRTDRVLAAVLSRRRSPTHALRNRATAHAVAHGPDPLSEVDESLLRLVLRGSDQAARVGRCPTCRVGASPTATSAASSAAAALRLPPLCRPVTVLGVRRTAIVSVLVGCLMAMFACSSGASASRSCGTFTTSNNGVTSTYAATVLRGNVRCRVTRRVLRAFASGKGTLHGPVNGPAVAQSWTLFGWRCGHGAGGGACIRGGSSYKNARDWIEYQYVP